MTKEQTVVGVRHAVTEPFSDQPFDIQGFLGFCMKILFSYSYRYTQWEAVQHEVEQYCQHFYSDSTYTTEHPSDNKTESTTQWVQCFICCSISASTYALNQWSTVDCASAHIEYSSFLANISLTIWCTILLTWLGHYMTILES